MMDDLPLELLEKCMSYLNYEAKLTCLLVCKSWNKISRKFAYETVFIKESPERFFKMYTFFDNDKECGKLVKNLFALGFNLSTSVYVSLPSLFPNIKKFYIKERYECYISDFKWNTIEAKTQFSKWKDTIEDVKETGSPICTQTLFTETICPNLKILELNSVLCLTELDPVRFIKSVTSCAPNLTHLKLHYQFSFDLLIMEGLLNNTPKLKALTLTNAMFMSSEVGVDYSKIKLHPELETLAIQDCRFEDPTNGLWFLYFSNKLIYLKILCIFNSIAAFPLADQNNQRLFTNWVSKLSNLECYHVHDFVITENVIKVMDESDMRLKRIDLWSPNHRIEHFHYLLTNSKQKNALETITFAGTPYKSILHHFYDFTSILNKFTNLKHLTISRSEICILGRRFECLLHNTVPFDQLIKSVPNLETLKLDFAECLVEYDEDVLMPNCRLKNLVLMECNFNVINRFEDTTEGNERSWSYVENTVLPTQRSLYYQRKKYPFSESLIFIRFIITINMRITNIKSLPVM